MTIEKTKLRGAAIHEVGARLDDMLEAGTKELHAAEGGAHVARKASQGVLQVMEQADRDLDAGSLRGGIEEAKRIKSYLLKVHENLQKLATEQDARRLVATGLVGGMTKAVQATSRMHAAEMAKADRHDDDESPGGAATRKTMKQRRQEEADAAKPPRKAAKKRATKKAAKRPAKKAAKRAPRKKAKA